MHRSFFAVKDTTINSGSNLIDGTTFQDKNVGQDEVLELKKVYDNREFKHPTRMLIQFDANEVKNYITSSNVPSNYKLVLRLFETAGTSGLSNEYNIAAYPLSESWDEGIGKEDDNPKTTIGCSWLNRENRGGGISEVTWSNAGGTFIASDEVTQSFSLSSPDIEMDVTPIGKKWFSGENKNYGFLLRFSGSAERGTEVSGSVSESLDLVQHTVTTSTSSISESLTLINSSIESSSIQISQSLTLRSFTINHTTTSASISQSLRYEGLGADLDPQLIQFTVTANGASNYIINGEAQPNITLLAGNTYRFNYGDGTNGGHPFLLSTTDGGSHNGGSEYTTGVTKVGTIGDGGDSYLQLVVNDSTPDLFYYCSNHGGMGGALSTTNNYLTVVNNMSSSIGAVSSSISESLDLVNHFSSSISSSISQSLVIVQNTNNTTSSSISESLDLITHTLTTILSTGEAEDLKFFSRQTNTIYSPKLELRWDDHLPATGSNTGSLTPLDLSGQSENLIYQLHKRESYRETETVKFRFGARKRYINKSFSTSIQTISGSYFAEGSASYSVIDMATNENIIPFSPFTTMSCDPISPYFTQDLNTFEPNRAYKVLLRVKHNDGQVIVYDDDFEFILRS